MCQSVRNSDTGQCADTIHEFQVMLGAVEMVLDPIYSHGPPPPLHICLCPIDIERTARKHGHNVQREDSGEYIISKIPVPKSDEVKALEVFRAIKALTNAQKTVVFSDDWSDNSMNLEIDGQGIVHMGSPSAETTESQLLNDLHKQLSWHVRQLEATPPSSPATTPQ